MRYFLRLAYLGKNFSGWQRQPEAPSVQAVLEDALAIALQQPKVTLVGAGRTDAGVHALEMVAHLDLPEAIADIPLLLNRLNKMIGWDILVREMVAGPSGLHARFDAQERHYQYHLMREYDPFRQDTAAYYTFPLDFSAMAAATELLPGKRDFGSFCKSRTQVNTKICEVREARWELNGPHWVFHIRADRFLRNMVRAIVGSLLEVGRGRMAVDTFAQMMEAQDRRQAGPSAAAQGLYLSKIQYPKPLFNG